MPRYRLQTCHLHLPCNSLCNQCHSLPQMRCHLCRKCSSSRRFPHHSNHHKYSCSRRSYQLHCSLRTVQFRTNKQRGRLLQHLSQVQLRNGGRKAQGSMLMVWKKWFRFWRTCRTFIIIRLKPRLSQVKNSFYLNHLLCRSPLQLVFKCVVSLEYKFRLKGI